MTNLTFRVRRRFNGSLITVSEHATLEEGMLGVVWAQRFPLSDVRLQEWTGSRWKNRICPWELQTRMRVMSPGIFRWQAYVQGARGAAYYDAIGVAGTRMRAVEALHAMLEMQVLGRKAEAVQ